MIKRALKWTKWLSMSLLVLVILLVLALAGRCLPTRFACSFVGRAASIAAVESGASAGRTVSAFYFARRQLCG